MKFEISEYLIYFLVLDYDLLCLSNQLIQWSLIINLNVAPHCGIFYNYINDEFIYKIISLFYINRGTTEKFLDVTFYNRFILSIKVGYIDWHFVRRQKWVFFHFYTFDYFTLCKVGKYHKLYFILFDYLLHDSHRYYFAFKLVWFFKVLENIFFIHYINKFIFLFLNFALYKLFFLVVKLVICIILCFISYMHFYLLFKIKNVEVYDDFFKFRLRLGFYFFNSDKKIKDYFFSKDLYKLLPYYLKIYDFLKLKFLNMPKIKFVYYYFEIIMLVHLVSTVISWTIINFKYKIVYIAIDEFLLAFLYLQLKFRKLFGFVYIMDEIENYKSAKYWLFMKYLKDTKKNISSIRWNDPIWGMYSEDWNDHRDYYIYNEEIAEYDHFRRIWMDLERQDIEDNVIVHLFFNRYQEERIMQIFKFNNISQTFFEYKLFFLLEQFEFIRLSFYEIYLYYIYFFYYNLYFSYYFFYLIDFINFIFFKRYLIRFYFYHYLSVYFVFFKSRLKSNYIFIKMCYVFNHINFYLCTYIFNKKLLNFFELITFYFKLVYLYIFRKTFFYIIIFMSNWYYFIIISILFLWFFFDFYMYALLIKQTYLIVFNVFYENFFFIFFELYYLVYFKIKFLLFFDFYNYYSNNKLNNYIFSYHYFYSYPQRNFEANVIFYRKLWRHLTRSRFEYTLRLRPRHLKWKWIEKSHRRFILYFIWFKLVGPKFIFALKSKLIFYFFYVYYFLKWFFVYFVKISYINIKKIKFFLYLVYYLFVLKKLLFFGLYFIILKSYIIIFINGKELLNFLVGNFMFIKYYFIKVVFINIYMFILGIYKFVKYTLLTLLIYLNNNIKFFFGNIINFKLLFIDLFYMLRNINEYFINTLKKAYLWFGYPVKRPRFSKWGRWSFYYTRKLYYMTGGNTIFKSNKMYFKDENSFFMFHNYIDLNFVKKSFMNIDLVWSFNLFFIYLFYYLVFYIVSIFIITVLFKKMQNLLRDKKLINFDFFYNWQRLIMEDYDKLTNFETKIFSNFNNNHYAWHKYSKQEANELILLDDVEWNFDQWLKLENHIRTSLYRTKSTLIDKHDLYTLIYYQYYISNRFFNINKRVRQMYSRKIRSIRERYQYLKDLNYLVPFRYYSDFSKFKWLRKLNAEGDIWKNLLVNFFYNIEMKIIFVFNDINFKKFYNNMDLLEEIRIHGYHRLDFLYSPITDGLRDILFSTIYKDKSQGEVDIFNDLGVSFEKYILVDLDETTTLLPNKVFVNINKKLEWLYYMDKKLNNHFNFYLYEFWKQDLFLSEFFIDDISCYHYYSKSKSIFLGDKIDNVKTEYDDFDGDIVAGDLVEKPVADKFIVHEIKNESLIYLWALIICFYFFWLIAFYTKYTLASKRQIFHIIKYFWFFFLVFVQILNMKLYLFLFYNTIYMWRFYNGAYYEDESPLYKIYYPFEWYYKRKLQYEFWRLNLKFKRFYKFNMWNWKDVYYLQLCYLIMSNKGHSIFFDDLIYNNYWLFDGTLVVLILFISYMYILISLMYWLDWRSNRINVYKI